jgi:hypothetical protein
LTGDVGFKLINAIFPKVDVGACIRRGVTGIIHVKVHWTENYRCFNELFANCPHEGNCFKHAWVISLNKASHHIKIKCVYTYGEVLYIGSHIVIVGYPTSFTRSPVNRRTDLPLRWERVWILNGCGFLPRGNTEYDK